jgi:enamine deaminase RidA (YjgF/YER057c/UK114 family)
MTCAALRAINKALAHRFSFIKREPDQENIMSITRLHSNTRMSQTVIHNGIVYLAGQVGTPGKSTAEQTQEVVDTIDALLAEAGTDKSRLLQVTVWLLDMQDFAEMNSVYDKWIGGQNPPTRATGQVPLTGPDFRVEIIVIAALP